MRPKCTKKIHIKNATEMHKEDTHQKCDQGAQKGNYLKNK